jgi:hypothetical protein
VRPEGWRCRWKLEVGADVPGQKVERSGPVSVGVKEWGKGRAGKYEVFQPKIQEGRVFSLNHGTFGFDMLV